MGKLYDLCEEIEEHIRRNGLDVYRTRGQLALRAGFLISLVNPDDPDDPERIAALRTAVLAELGVRLD